MDNNQKIPPCAYIMSGLDNNFGTSAVLFVSLISTSAKFVNFAVVVGILIDLPF